MHIMYKKYGDFKFPTKGHRTDSGIDCYAPEDVVLEPFKVTKVGLHFGVVLPLGNYEMQLRPRSSMNAKGILTQFGTIDNEYTGEISVVFINLTNEPYEIKKNDKICQLVATQFVALDVRTEDETSRGQNGFGSTGK